MKRTVDLTENSAFSQPDINILDFKVFPWTGFRLVESFEDTQPNPLFLCGTAQDRKKRKEWIAYENGEFCERCGAAISPKPWRPSSCLCTRCNAELNREFNTLWRFKDNSIAESNDFLVVQMNRRTW